MEFELYLPKSKPPSQFSVSLPPSNVQKHTPYTAIIVEPRNHPALFFVLDNFLSNLNSHEWSLVILHGTENIDYLEDIIVRLQNERKHNQDRIQKVNLGVANLLYNQYNELFFNPAFYDYIPTETFLVFQTDSMILPENKNKIYNYLNYDYVGAPWCNGHYEYSYENGNGGLSLRKKSKMLELLSHYSPDLRIPKNGNFYIDDYYFCGYHFPNVQMRKANLKEASEFSVETLYGENPFGIHKVWAYSPYQYILQKYSYIQQLKELQKK